MNKNSMQSLGGGGSREGRSSAMPAWQGLSVLELTHSFISIRLLAKMDGADGLWVFQLYWIGLTNKPTLIDPHLRSKSRFPHFFSLMPPFRGTSYNATLHIQDETRQRIESSQAYHNASAMYSLSPERFEVQIEVPKPRTVEQRIAILKVHTERYSLFATHEHRTPPIIFDVVETEKKASPRDELLDIIAVECDGMSGASLAGVARAAASRALKERGNSIADCLVAQGDFEKAIEDVFESARSGNHTRVSHNSRWR
ncbi:LOW QUALITY PROTEIN: hypothetical protein ACHAW5_004274 [Stephanodiscus triporus]|uniref:Uncharacterized protein n=1 Tax=Stephanodiscus triporus TaxID=2934178 RepID=A0ABD3MC66_9STRA